MSWDVSIFKLNKPATRLAEMDDSYQLMPMGRAEEVRAQISKYIPEVDWSDPTWGMLVQESYSIEFSLGKDEIIEHIMLHVRGCGDVIPVIIRFCRPADWSMVDASMSEFIDPDNPSNSGWQGFQAYRDRVVKISHEGHEEHEV